MVTLKDIANELNLAQSTVSHALRGTGTISETTRKRIVDTARRLNYTKLPHVINDEKTTVSRIAVVSGNANENNEVFSRFWRGITDVSGVPLFILNEPTHTSFEQIIFEPSYNIQAFIAYGFEPETPLGEKIYNSNIKGVYINRGSERLEISTVSCDYLVAFSDIVDILVAKGHKKILFANYTKESWVAGRYRGYRLGMEKHNLKPAVLEIASPSHVFQGFMDLPDRYTALVCVNDVLALSFIREAKEHNVKIPSDVAVTGFDNLRASAMSDPPLTTYDLPAERMGSIAAHLVDNLVNGKFSRGNIVIPATFIARKSI